MKNQTSDARYLERRKTFSETKGAAELWSVIDHWPLYAGLGNLARYMANADILRDTLDVPGHIAEFGSWRGANLLLFAKLLKIYDNFGPKLVHCFDSFDGLSAFSEEDGAAAANHGMYRGSLDELMAVLELYEMQDDVVIHQGLVEQTVSQVLADDPSLSFSLVYCDLDLYEGTKVVLEAIHPRLSVGGMIAFDQWNEEEYPGETVAVREFLEVFGDQYETVALRHTRRPSLLLRKLSSVKSA